MTYPPSISARRLGETFLVTLVPFNNLVIELGSLGKSRIISLKSAEQRHSHLWQWESPQGQAVILFPEMKITKDAQDVTK